jgi:hypothetical protein
MRLDSAPACALAAMLLASLFSIALLSRHEFNAGALVVAGDQYTDPARAPRGLPVERHSAGYDGQFYYRLALNPFTHRWSEYGIRLDVPTYRQQRILMPLIAWIFSLGNSSAIPWLFLIINIGGVALLAWCSSRLAAPWWSAAIWLYPGWLLTLSRDCSEIVEVSLLMATALALQRRRFALATILGTLAVLAKETALLGIIGLTLMQLPAAFAPLIVPVVAHLALKMLLFNVWQAQPSLGTGHFAIPFSGLIHSFSLARPFPMMTNLELAALAVMAVVPLTLLGSARTERRVRGLWLAWLFYIPLIAVLDEGFWIEDWSFMRAATEFWVFAALLGATSSRTWIRITVVSITIVTWCALAAHVLIIRS